MSENSVIHQNGEETLQVISKADRFNDWMYSEIRPYLSGNILEIGSGIGNISDFLLMNHENVSLSDYNLNYCKLLNQRFSGKRNLKNISNINLVEPDFHLKYSSVLESFDTILALNVIEHIDDDNQAIENCRKLLKKEGKLIILVPACQALFNHFDKELGHFRRYSKMNLLNLFNYNKFAIESIRYFNVVGIFGWYLSGKILNKKIIPQGQMSLFNKMVFFIKIIDKILFHSIGLSIIAIGRKL
jgi:SAM-dependent methyltransferase